VDLLLWCLSKACFTLFLVLEQSFPTFDSYKISSAFFFLNKFVKIITKDVMQHDFLFVWGIIKLPDKELQKLDFTPIPLSNFVTYENFPEEVIEHNFIFCSIEWYILDLFLKILILGEISNFLKLTTSMIEFAGGGGRNCCKKF